jgi:hypothetical protein
MCVFVYICAFHFGLAKAALSNNCCTFRSDTGNITYFVYESSLRVFYAEPFI